MALEEWPFERSHPTKRETHVDREAFYRKLVQALHSSGFLLRASDLSDGDLSTDRDELSRIARAIARLPSPAGSGIHPFFDEETVQQRLDKMHDWAAIVSFKYVLAQPVLAAGVEADRLASDEIVNLVHRFNGIVLEMLDVTGRLGGTKLGGFQISKGIRLSVTGIILFIFFDPALASTFIERTQRRCKILHFFKKTWVLPWMIDVSSKIVSSHRGLPFLPGVLSRERFQQEIFQ